MRKIFCTFDRELNRVDVIFKNNNYVLFIFFFLGFLYVFNGMSGIVQGIHFFDIAYRCSERILMTYQCAFYSSVEQ